LDIKPNLLYRWRKEAKQARVAIMRKEGLRSVVRKKFVVTTDSKHNYPVVGNLLNRNFLVSGPDQVWVSDLTYIRTLLEGYGLVKRSMSRKGNC
jgi:transposase InsO family protein